MWSARLFYFPLFLLILTQTLNRPVKADDDTDEYDVKARVVRISLVEGEVSLKRNGSSEWERARLNFTLVEGDTVSTGADGRVEIQVDSHKFLRLARGSVMRIVTLRDEGMALSVVEGTMLLRLSKFDREHQYFEIDAPGTTLAAEKDGLYRVDVGHEGHVTLTVRDGGSARIYSDTSGFPLRSGRMAELVAEGEESGDWNLSAAGPADAFDQWVDQREQYLAQRMRFDVQYYDEYVWGAEDLEAYGDWIFTSDYGWIWRPGTSVISAYNDWAPYRYGYWSWTQPYGWTWVGSEPWGWAPYHYGRWVFYNGYWAWCPRSFFYKKRSWWRPALVAFVSIDFDQSYCWYPLHYHQRDPHSRNYHGRGPGNREPQPPGKQEPGAPSKKRGYLRAERIDPAQLHAVSGVAAKDLGRDVLRPYRPNDGVARKVLESDPLQGDPNVVPGTGTRTGQQESGVFARPGRVTPGLSMPDRGTGATIRRPGFPLDDELRRRRVFNGRDPGSRVPSDRRSGDANETRSSGAVNHPSTQGDAAGGDRESGRDRDRNINPGSDRNSDRRSVPQQTSPSPAVAAPVEPQPSSPDRVVRPTDVEPGEKRSRERRERIETATPGEQRVETRNDTPAPRNQPPPSAPAERANEPRSEARTEPPARSERRSQDAPVERSAPRNERRSEPRTESPRTESPRTERTESPRTERTESPRTESPRTESPRTESPRTDSPRTEAPRTEAPRTETPRSEAPRTESPRTESPRTESPRSDTPRSESPRPEGPRKP